MDLPHFLGQYHDLQQTVSSFAVQSCGKLQMKRNVKQNYNVFRCNLLINSLHTHPHTPTHTHEKRGGRVNEVERGKERLVIRSIK